MPKRPARKSRRIVPSVSQSEVLLTLSLKQRQLLAEILGNVGVAWFTIGIISPLFLDAIFPSKLFFSVGLGILFSIGFVISALLLVKDKG